MRAASAARTKRLDLFTVFLSLSTPERYGRDPTPIYGNK
jgi:hypothetical protein